MAEVDNENKITFEELAPSLQELFKNTVTKDSYDELVKKLESIANNLGNITDQFVKKTEVWEAFHKLEDNYNPEQVMLIGIAKVCIFQTIIDLLLAINLLVLVN